MENKEITQKVQELGLTIESVFVPWSLSRNAGERFPSLNWKVTLLHNGKKVLTTDYGAGCGHCPSYKQNDNSYDQRQIILSECESGFKSKLAYSMGFVKPDKKSPILPDSNDVIYSLVLDSDAIDYEFEEWAGNYGYSEDSREAEKTYNQCKEIGLKLLRAVGTNGLEKLHEIFQDY
jgi:hypothetical protein